MHSNPLAFIRHWLVNCLIILAILGVGGIFSSGAAESLEHGHTFLENFSVQEMAGASQNFGIVQDEDGLIYVANLMAVLQYDGERWKSIYHPDKLRPISIDIDKEGRIFVGLQGDFGIIEQDARGRERIISLRSQLPEGKRQVGYIWGTRATPDGIIFRSPDHIYRWRHPARAGEKGQMDVWEFPAENKLLSLTWLNDKGMFWQKNVGLMTIGEETCTPVENSEYFSDIPVRSIAEFSGDTLLLTCEHEGLYLFDGKKGWKFNTPANRYAELHFGVSTIKLPDGRYAMGTRSGGLLLFKHDGSVDQIIDKESGLIDNSVLGEPFLDVQEGLWLPLNYGLARAEALSPIEYFDYDLGIEGNVHAIQRHKGTLYAGTSQGLRALIPSETPGRPAVFTPVPEATSRFGALQIVRDELYAISARGLERIHGPNRPPELIQAFEMAYSIGVSPDSNRIFVGSYIRGLHSFHWNGRKWNYEGRIEGTSDQVLLIATTTNEDVWLSTNYRQIEHAKLDLDSKGAVIDAEVSVYDTSNGLPVLEHYYPLVLNGDYFAGNPEGLFKYDPETDQFRHASILGMQFASGQQGMWNMTMDAAGGVWFNSRFGKGARVVPGENGSYELNYPLLRVSDATFLCFFPEQEGSVLWAGGENGRLIRYDDYYTMPDTATYKALVRQVAARDTVLFSGGKSIDWQPPRLPFDLNSLRFNYTIPRYDAPESKRYQYRLVGLSDEWSDWTDETYRDFNSLTEGRYRFEVRGYDVYYFKSEIGSFEFVILPPWYRSLWAYMIYIGAIAGLLFLLYKWSVRRVEAQNRRLEELVNTRTQQLAQAHQEIKQHNERLEQLLDERTRHLIVSERQAVFGQLVQGIVHNLKNPLTSSTTSAGMIRLALERSLSEPGAVKDEKKTAKLLQIIQDAVDYIEKANASLNDMINSLLTKSRSDRSDHKEVIDLNTLMQSEIQFLKADRRFVKMSDNRVNIDDDEIPVTVVPGEFAQVIQNVVYNALDAMYEVKDPKLSIRTFRQNGEAVVEVIDNGKGIPKDIRMKVFDPFFSTKSPQGVAAENTDEPKGTGLGLWMCQQAVESFGGRIELDSEVNIGTTFRIILPIARN